ncbi:RasGEF [Dermatophagoides farinae]|uniref:RasGEF n=1 Tax=Dermatophagoides farinae TaxID=6954 RepID=A0A922I331_DERFA|nr:RasGEF [Dermatophagoides farinae]
MLSVADSSFSSAVAAAASSLSSSSSSSSSLRRSISTPTTLFSLKTLTSEDSTSGTNRLWTHNSTSISLYRLMNKISAETFAKQLTLIDWIIFLKIKRDELKPGQWTGSMKHVLSPNIVLFTRRFNIVTYWAIDEILCLKTPKQRAEMISFFIKLINNLIEIHNLHSSYAIKSALNSASIHRLEKTWNCLSKKDRQCFEKIDALFSESDNSNKLRTFMEMAIKQTKNSNCIPNLATYLRDIIHIDSAFPQSDTQRANLRHEKLESIYTFIEKCQQSNEIEIEEDVHKYLVSLRYIEELQKFREDDYFKTSLKLEPDPNIESRNNYQQKKLSYLRFSSHYDIRALQQQSDPSSSSSSSSAASASAYHQQNQSTLELNNSDYAGLLNKSFNGESLKNSKELSISSDFKPGHRKTYSLETNLYLSTNNIQNVVNNKNSNNNNNNNQCSSSSSPINNRSSKNLKMNLIDDSPIIINNDPIINTYQVSHVYNKRDKKPTLEMFKRKSEESYLSPNGGGITNLEDWNTVYPDRYERWTYTDKDIIHKGCVNRKTVLKDKKKPPFSFWTNYHLRLTSDSLLFFNSKSNNQLKETPNLRACKKFPLLEWSVFDNGNINQHSNKTTNVFTLADHSCSTIYKIRTLTETEAKDWIRLIKQATNNLRQFYI